MTTTAGGPGDERSVADDGTGEGDYGYDEAHDDVVRGTSGGADDTRRRDVGAPGAVSDDRPDAGGDYGYDEAHDLR